MMSYEDYMAADRDRAERWLPSPAARAMAAAMLAADPDAEMAVVPMVQPGKTRGIWTRGQRVLTVPGVYVLAGGKPGAHMPYVHARNLASSLAREALATQHPEGGTVAHALIERDGEVAVFED